MTHLREEAISEYFNQPIVDQINPQTLISQAVRHRMDFRIASESDFYVLEVPFEYTLSATNLVHGFGFWFDTCFCGEQTNVWLSTAPTEELTHWYQVKCLLKQPLFVREGETIKGVCKMTVNKRQSYDIVITATNIDSGITSVQDYDLKNPYFRYNGQQQAAQPGSHKETSPSHNLHNGVTVHAVGEQLNGKFYTYF